MFHSNTHTYNPTVTPTTLKIFPSVDRRRYFDAPRGVAWLADGRLAVTDFNLHRVVIVEANMQQARFIGGEGGNYLQFRRPQVQYKKKIFLINSSI